ncbi:MAG: TonB family protein [Alteraurantiacibacter sp.]
MAYSNATVSPAARLRAATGVIAIHALVGAGIIAGLSITGVITKDDGGLVAYFNPDPPAPPPPPPKVVPEPMDQALAPVTAPTPPIALDRPRPIEVEPVTPDISSEVILTPPKRNLEIPGPAVVPLTPPAAAITPVGASPANGPAGWITTNDYARSDLVREREGTAGYRLVIGSNGRVDACEITRSSGHATLDRNTCRLLERRARFNPATNNQGNSTVGTYTGTVTWQIPAR